ncbi:MAG: hypothetical protein JWL84_743 [Rhodospirillales bacterium]|nr:hypothetical protein [Rhodospirillales bacterium]
MARSNCAGFIGLFLATHLVVFLAKAGTHSSGNAMSGQWIPAKQAV